MASKSVSDPSAADDNHLTHLLVTFCRALPDDWSCDSVPSYYAYRPSPIPNAVFAAIFLVSLAAFAATYNFTRRGHLFNLAMLLGVGCEALGYVARIVSSNNPWVEWPFTTQLCSLTIGQALLAVGIYLCLPRVVRVFGVSASRVPTAWYARVFVPCGVVALVLQAVGCWLASRRSEEAQTGGNVVLAGLGFQVLTMFVFMLVAGDFAARAWRRGRRGAYDTDAVRLARLRSSRRFRCFLGTLALSTGCIFLRCVFRVAELSGGWGGPLMEREDLFIGFEGVMIVVAVLGLNVFHPGFCSRELLEDGSKSNTDDCFLEDRVSSGFEDKVKA